jgi:BarH-like
LINNWVFFFHFRTKWKRQTAVGLELLAEAGNYAAFQRLYGAPPYIGAWPYQGQGPPGVQPSAADMYYRQAAVAALQKPLPYRLYPNVHPSLGGLGQITGPSVPFPHLSASSSLSSLSSYYQNNNNNNTHNSNNNNNNSSSNNNHNNSQSSSNNNNPTNASSLSDQSSSRRSPSPTLNPGSPPGRSESNPASDDDDTIQVWG